MKPKRIQRRRTKGWKMPPNTVYVGRPSKWGNPFTMRGCRDAGYRGSDSEIRARCVEAFKVWLGPHWRENWDGDESEKRRKAILENLHGLKGKNLMCWCPLDHCCHADVLIEIANSKEES